MRISQFSSWRLWIVHAHIFFLWFPQWIKVWNITIWILDPPGLNSSLVLAVTYPVPGNSYAQLPVLSILLDRSNNQKLYSLHQTYIYASFPHWLHLHPMGLGRTGLSPLDYARKTTVWTAFLVSHLFFRINICLCVCMLSCFSHAWQFVTLWTVACQALLSMNYPGKSTGVGFHVILQGIFPTQGSNPGLLCLLHLQVSSLPLVPLRKPKHLSMVFLLSLELCDPMVDA